MGKMLGAMLDCSRNAVIKVDKAKEFALALHRMGYNTLLLYMEDTYEIEGHPYFGHLRGRYSQEELRELDGYCRSIGIELIPCIQTLGHLARIFQWEGVYTDINDCDAILLAGEEKTYDLIRAMLTNLKSCLSTDKIHIGMDEAARVGLGRYRTLHGDRDRFDIINEHLHRVCDIAKELGLEPMIWSDMFCQLAMSINHFYMDGDPEKIKEKAALPENVALVYWDYYHLRPEHYERQLQINKMFNRPVYFAGGAWTWGGFAPDNRFSIKTTEVALDRCRESGIDGFFITMWGDDGGECSPFAVLPSLLYAAEVYRGNKDIDAIKAKFKDLFGLSWDDFMLLDDLDLAGERHRRSSSKQMLYNDPLMGLHDGRITPDMSDYYRDLAARLRRVQADPHGLMFTQYADLAELLSLKATIGIRARAAYTADDREAMAQVLEDYPKLLASLEKFYDTFRRRWMADNKPFGFEVQDARLGGLRQRLEHCLRRLQEWQEKGTPIAELEEPVLEKSNNRLHWSAAFTASF